MMPSGYRVFQGLNSGEDQWLLQEHTFPHLPGVGRARITVARQQRVSIHSPNDPNAPLQKTTAELQGHGNKKSLDNFKCTIHPLFHTPLGLVRGVFQPVNREFQRGRRHRSSSGRSQQFRLPPMA